MILSVYTDQLTCQVQKVPCMHDIFVRPDSCGVHADLLADLSASQLLAQADLADCNSPLKIVQIGGDDLFETDDTAANEFLLDAEVAM